MDKNDFLNSSIFIKTYNENKPLFKVKQFLSKEKITNELLCSIASSEELGTCPGDSGGPLIYYDQDADKNLQIGIVYGSLQECSDQTYPSIYARLDNYYNLNFIRETAFGDTIDRPVEIDGKVLHIILA